MCVFFAQTVKSQLYYNAGWTDHGTGEIDAYGWTMSNVGDVNGDGYDDFLSGGPGWSDVDLEQGRVSLYYGGPSGITTDPVWSYSSLVEHGEVGFSSDGGDLNGDGYSDIIVGCLEWPGTYLQQGKAILFYGGPAGPSSTPDWEFTEPQFLALMGSSVALSGDVNNDGYNDLFITAKMYDDGQTDEGKVWMFSGSPSGPIGPSWTWEPDQSYAIGGFPVNYAGDVNGDGYDDVIIGANQYDYAKVDDGLAVCFYGSATGLASAPDWTQSSDQKKCNFGHWVDGAGDVNGDGYDDVIISSLLYSNGSFHEGRAWVFNGGPAGLSHGASWIGESNMEGAQFGYCVGGAGDIDNDGYDDVVVGAKYWADPEIDEGACFVFFGSPSGLDTDWCWQDESNQAGAYYGRMVGGVADFNNDGYSDFFTSAYRYTDSIFQDGKAWLFYGKPRENAFHYSAASYSTTDPDPTPVIDGLAGGIFTAPAGVAINSATGTIDVSASTPGGPYNITYTITSTCTLSKTVQVSITSSCAAPTGVHVSGITSTGATIQWNAVAGSTGYKVFIRKLGSPAAKYNTATNIYTATALSPSSSYQVWVEARCGLLYSANSAKKSFMTTPLRLENSDAQLSVYPDPASNFVYLSMGCSGNVSVRIFDAQGKVMITKELISDKVFNYGMDISSLPEGFYTVLVINGQNSYSKPLLVVK